MEHADLRMAYAKHGLTVSSTQYVCDTHACTCEQDVQAVAPAASACRGGVLHTLKPLAQCDITAAQQSAIHGRATNNYGR